MGRHPGDAARDRLVARVRLATALDRELRAACRTEAAARLALGATARAFLRRRAYHRLGFARLGDYARERLGVSARTLESAGRVAARLERLPRIRAAFTAGELSWSKLRLLAAVAAPEDEVSWLAQAGRGSVAELAAIVAARGGTEAADALDGDGADTIDGEDVGGLRIACPGRVRILWRRACELASRLSGGRIAAWQAAEAVAAEAIAGRPAGAGIGDRVLLALARASRRRAFDPASPDAAAAVASRTSTPAPGASPPTPAPLPSLSSRADGEDPFELDRRLRAAVQRLRPIEPEVGRLLRLLVDHRLHRTLGARSLAEYCRERLGISLRKAWALIKVERRVRTLPSLAASYEDGRLSWVRALTLLPVVDRTNCDRWLARADAVTVRRLGDEVGWVLDCRDVLGAGASLAPPAVDHPLDGVQIGARPGAGAAGAENVTPPGAEVVDGEVRFAGPATVVALFRDALDAYAPAGGARWVALERMLRRVVTDWENGARHADPIFERDGWRCAVPACSGRRNLHDHHIRFRSRGGGNERANRITVCAAHHLHGIHAGYIRARGAVPWVRWELPLASYEGRDRYAKSVRSVSNDFMTASAISASSSAPDGST